jgi:hypothetical protein
VILVVSQKNGLRIDMSASAGTAETRKARAIQELEKFPAQFCTGRLRQLFEYDIQAKGSADPTLATHAHVCKNDILFVLDHVMSFPGPGIITSHVGRKSYDPYFFASQDEQYPAPTLSAQAKELVTEYDKHIQEVLARYDEESAKERAAMAEEATAVAAAVAAVPPRGRITSFFNRVRPPGKGGYKPRSSRKRRN